MNSDETESLVFSSSNRPRPTFDSLNVDSENARCSTTARNIGVTFSDCLVYGAPCCRMCSSPHFSICVISLKSESSCPVPNSAKTLVHASITSNMDYCNALLYDQPKCVL